MMVTGKAKEGAQAIRWNAADALHLPFPDNIFDAVTSGFGVRNFIDREQAFREQRRVVKPGGRVICLEISKPPEKFTAPVLPVLLQQDRALRRRADQRPARCLHLSAAVRQ